MFYLLYCCSRNSPGQESTLPPDIGAYRIAPRAVSMLNLARQSLHLSEASSNPPAQENATNLRIGIVCFEGLPFQCLRGLIPETRGHAGCPRLFDYRAQLPQCGRVL